ncbi:MAG: metal-sulfur cluster assembly factor [bacterium]|nr:metal-sulfur cluster assembly factor [bacterium]MDZ4296200.1 metal-sulfur cluster assembly factor [Patescibacteria group bacterium]
MTQDAVKKALTSIIDPELGVNIVDLGLVYDVQFRGGAVKVTMTLTTPACPLDDYFRKAIEEALRKVPGVVSVEVVFTFEPLWDRSRMSEAARLQLGIR